MSNIDILSKKLQKLQDQLDNIRNSFRMLEFSKESSMDFTALNQGSLELEKLRVALKDTSNIKLFESHSQEVSTAVKGIEIIHEAYQNLYTDAINARRTYIQEVLSTQDPALFSKQQVQEHSARLATGESPTYTGQSAQVLQGLAKAQEALKTFEIPLPPLTRFNDELRKVKTTSLEIKTILDVTTPVKTPPEPLSKMEGLAPASKETERFLRLTAKAEIAFKDLSATMSSAEGVTEFFQRMQNQMAMTKQDVQELQNLLGGVVKQSQLVPESREELGSAVQAAAFATNAGGFGFKSPKRKPLIVDLKGDLEESSSLANQLRVSGSSADKVFQELTTRLGTFIKKTRASGTQIKNLRAEINGTTSELTLFYNTLNKENNIASLSAGSITGNLKTGSITPDVAAPLPTRGAGDFAYLKENAAYVQDLYRATYARVKKIMGEMQEQGKIQILDSQSEIRVDEVTGAVDILIKYIDRTSDKVGVLRQELVSLSAVDVGGKAQLTKPASLFEETKQRFGDNAVTFERNLTAALKDSSLTVKDLTKAHTDQASSITKVTLSKRGLRGATEGITLSFNKEGHQIAELNQKYAHFTKALGQSIVRVARYAVAANLIYSVVNRLGELPEVAMSIETSLTRLSTLSQLSTNQVGAYFNSAIDVARKYGFSLEDVLENAEDAIRAAGGENTSDAMTLLGDAMLFSKISGESLSSSMDTLVASLTQMGLKLTDGRQLMESWIVLSQQFRVGIEDLSEVYANVGSTATNVLSKDPSEAMHELNALITVAEKVTPFSSARLGSFLKTLFSSMSSPEVVQDLKAYGIQIEDNAKNQRDFFEVLKDVYTLTTKYEALGSGALTAISSRMGAGGSRYASPTASLIENMDEVEKALKISKTADINYNDFIAQLTNTLQLEVNKLKLGFSELAVTLGESGAIEDSKEFVASLTSMVSAINTLTKSIGPSLLALGKLLGAVGGVGYAFQKLHQVDMLTGISRGSLSSLTDPLSTFFATARKNSSKAEGIGLLLVTSLMTAVQSGANNASVPEMVGANIVNAIGVSIGYALGGIPGGMIGQQISAFFTKLVREESAKVVAAAQALAELDYAALYEQAPKEIFGEDKMLGTTAFKAVMERVPDRAEQQMATALDTDFLSQDFIMEWAEESSADAAAWKEIIRVYNELITVKEKVVTLTIEEAEHESKVDEIRNRRALSLQELGDTLVPGSGTFTKYTETDEYARGIEGIVQKAFNRVTQSQDMSLSTFQSITHPEGSLSKAVPAAQLAMVSLSSYTDDAQLSFMDLVEIYAFGSPEIADYVSGIVGELSNMVAELDLLKESGGDYTALETQVTKKQDEAWELLQMLKSSSLPDAGQLQMPSSLDWRDTTVEQRQRAIELAFIMQDSFVQALEWSEAEYISWKERLDPVYIQVDTSEFEKIEDVSSQFMGLALQKVQEGMNDLDSVFNMRRLPDVEPEKFSQIEQSNQYWTQYIAALKGLSQTDYMQEEGQEFNLIMGPGNNLRKINSTAEAMNFVLQDILETEKKQLEGIWNIPEGATFWVPLTSAFYNEQKQPGIEGLTEISLGTGTNQIAEGGRLIYDAAVLFNTKLTTPFQTILNASQSPAEKAMEFYKKIYPSDILEHPSDVQPTSVDKDFSSHREISPEDTLISRTFIPSYDEPRERYPHYNTPITVTVPSLGPVYVESQLNAVVTLDERVIARSVKKVLSREMSKNHRKKTYSVPIGKV